MLIHVDTSVLVDAFTGPRRSLGRLERVTREGEVVTFCSIVLYEWRRGPRTDDEVEAVSAFFQTERVPAFGEREAKTAAALYRRVKRARQRQADLVIAACAIEQGATLWTLDADDFDDVPGLTLFRQRAS
jgi:predicted nucleic acid-binding protein